MSTIREKCNIMQKALTGILPAVYHYGGGTVKDQYIEWMEDGEGSGFYHDDLKEQTLHGAVNLYSLPQKVGDIPDKIQDALRSICEPNWSLQLVTVEYLSEKTTSTRYVHFRWEWEL